METQMCGKSSIEFFMTVRMLIGIFTRNLFTYFINWSACIVFVYAWKYAKTNVEWF